MKKDTFYHNHSESNLNFQELVRGVNVQTHLYVNPTLEEHRKRTPQLFIMNHFETLVFKQPRQSCFP